MFRRLSNSWALSKASARVLAADKELVVFPLLSALALMLVTASFAVPMIMLQRGEHQRASGPVDIAVGFVFYTVAYFIIFFCNSALVGAALIRLRGGDPTVSDGFRIAFGKIGLIFQYALIAATVGMILRTIQERAGLLGRIVIGFIGMGWNLATFLVVPVLVTEDVGPIDAVKRSTTLLKQTWGEQVVGNFGIGTVTTFVGFLLCLIFIPLVAMAGMSGSVPLIAAAVIGFIVSVLVLALINATLSGIYTAALYRYASEGTIGEGFGNEMVEQAFRAE